MSMMSNQDNGREGENRIPGYIEGGLLNILEYDALMLSDYGLKLAKAFKQVRDKEEDELRLSAKELDSLFPDD